MSRRVAFVTSGAKGLGHATVRALFEAEWDVCFTYGRSRAEAEQLLAQARRLGRRAAALQVDLLDKPQVEQAVQACLQEFHHIDAVIHNFGPFVFERLPLAVYTDAQWNRMMDGNLNNFFWMYRLTVMGMRERRFGRFVTVGSDGAATAAGWHSRAAYAAAKSGLASLTRSIAKEEHEFGITANMVCPGDIRGDLKMRTIDEVAVPGEPPGARPPVGEDVARMIAFLCDDRSQQVNGTVVEVTGGREIRARDSQHNESQNGG
ncbi:SDR family oxidoreductase [Alicyclobacillus cycloheptanicus]|uniref:3-oxoacyl-[acyl-carrier protein] reductase n=1 Tax=Alicyclobacillus cycloheptanicus TaxID=1457 RepID=A0ABT9XEC2_9BACL|nr:SDR family oxidoreductase [Alicyclobacillus cycloheptanicus]MDQ0188652.1 3-oxoacyl-[acyl-carrier protein] reductase [Alicyclobacillus cycloheptanicus]WDM00673.1 SDR family oxidoreductase [Alicyclobacillus cycloheptanicus]